MKKECIIPFTILFFIFVGILAWFAVEGNIASIIMLNILGGIFLFSVFVLFPAIYFRKFLPSKLTFGQPLITSIVSFLIFWTIVGMIIFIKPKWGWNYVHFFDRYVLPLIKGLL